MVASFKNYFRRTSNRVNPQLPNGMARFKESARDSETSLAWPNRRFRFRLFAERRWRIPGLRRSNLPVPVILKRLAIDFFVFCMAGFGEKE
jgi:hypothetical protein